MIISNDFKVSGVYCIFNTVSKKKYVGSSINMYHRLHKHKSQLKRGEHQNSHLLSSCNKHGIDKFECSILFIGDKEEYLPFEQKELDSGNYLFNQNLSATTTILSDCAREKISTTLKMRHKIGELQPTKKTSILVYDSEGVFYKEYDTIKQTSIDMVIPISGINKVLAGIQKHCHRFQFLRKSVNNPVKLDALTLHSVTSNSRCKKLKKMEVKDNVSIYDLRTGVTYTSTQFKAFLCDKLNLDYDYLPKYLHKMRKADLQIRLYKNRYIIKLYREPLTKIG